MFAKFLFPAVLAFLSVIVSAWLFNHVNPYLGILLAVAAAVALLIYLNQILKK
jgi:hypothetical protein